MEQQGTLDTETPKRKHTEVTMASPSDTDSASPDAKKPYQPELEQFDLNAMPSDNASAADWGKYMVEQMSVLNRNIQALAQSANFAGDQASDALKEIGSVSTSVGKLTMKMMSMKNENASLKQQNSDLNEKILSLECYQRRNNLRFDGIREERYETDYDCYWKVVQVLNEIPEFQNCAENVRISRCHRVGPYIPNRIRPIIAHFHWFGDLNFILHHRGQLPHGVYVGEDYPDEIMDRRSHLRPIYKAAVNHPEFRGHVKMHRDQLIIKGKVYTIRPVDNLDQLPDALNLIKLCQKEDNNTIAFLGYGSPASNFNKAPFTIDNVRYVSNEQYACNQKALLFNDEVTARKIMNETSPYKIQKLGRQVKNVVQQQWEREGPKIVEKGAFAKFRQNDKQREWLLSTGEKTIVEASPSTFWGTGVRLSDNRALLPGQWSGQDHLGKILMRVRATLRSEIIQNA